MKNALVTGATGLVGRSIVLQLLLDGWNVRALVRNRQKASVILPPSCELFEGDISEKIGILSALQGCSIVFHAAGIPEQWFVDTSIFREINVGGTRNVVQSALTSKVEKFVYLSTMDILHAPSGCGFFNETMLDAKAGGSPYRQSKWWADQIVVESLEQGLPAVFIHPTAIYGKPPYAAFWFTDLIIKLHRKKLPILPPGGLPFVHCDDIASGCILAAKKARPGERFILDDAYASFEEMVGMILQEIGIEHRPPVGPPWLARTLAKGGALTSRFTRSAPLLHEPILDLLLREDRPDSSKARRELGWSSIPLREGIRKTIQEMRDWGMLRSAP